MKLNEKSIDQLKALAYDLIVEAERIQKNIQLVNQVIAQKQSVEPKLETPLPSEDK